MGHVHSLIEHRAEKTGKMAISVPGSIKSEFEKLETDLEMSALLRQRNTFRKGPNSLNLSVLGGHGEEIQIWEETAVQELAKMFLKFWDYKRSFGTEQLKLERSLIPRLETNHFQFGQGHPADQEFIIYLRLDRCEDAWNDFFEQLHLTIGSKIEISISLKCYKYEFCQRRIPFQFTPNLDLKFSVRCNEKNLAPFMTNLSSKIQVLVAEEGQESENSKVVLASESIFYGTLVHSMASLSFCKVFDVKSDAESGHPVSCYVFLDRQASSSQNSKNSGSFCKNCVGESHLMTIFDEVRRSSSVIDLVSCSQLKATGPMEIDSLEPQKLNAQDDDDDECMDLRIKKVPSTTTTAATAETVPETPLEKNPPSTPKQEASDSKVLLTQSSKGIGVQGCENHAKETETASKAKQQLRKLKAKPIQRKHKGLSRQAYLRNKVQQMQQRLLELEKQRQMEPFAEPELLKNSTSQSEAQIPSGSFTPPQPPLESPTTTFILVQNPDGSNTMVPESLLNQISNQNSSIPLTPVATNNNKGGNSSEEKSYKCPEQGCNERFNNKSSLSRHRKKVHFPDRLHKCHNCGHAFPRPYMLHRHLEHRVCLPKDVSRSKTPVLFSTVDGISRQISIKSS